MRQQAMGFIALRSDAVNQVLIMQQNLFPLTD